MSLAKVRRSGGRSSDGPAPAASAARPRRHHGVRPEHGPLIGLGLPHPPAHRVTAPPGTLLLLVTDGFIERRREDLQTSLESLAEAAGEGSADPEETCARLFDRLSPDGNDDVALMAVRLNPIPTD
ncbi:SpoIIE family protein phosphatase [Streptomyces sp. NPDC058145]|uniref:SpoIIE family protein phosphatase n=1 Tax=Streptomyces sp. NPDC058145 TaxID=3346356 RepID=UPI0036E63710